MLTKSVGFDSKNQPSFALRNVFNYSWYFENKEAAENQRLLKNS